MAAALVTPVDWSYVHDIRRIDRVLKVTQNDWVFLNAPGAFNPVINNYAGTVDTFTYGTGTINNTGTAYSTTSTEIAVDALAEGIINNTTTVITPFYFETTSGELIMVITNTPDSGTESTFTCIRGCLGTTASATGLADGNTIYLKNLLTLTGAGVGYTIIEYTPMPNEAKSPMFKA